MASTTENVSYLVTLKTVGGDSSSFLTRRLLALHNYGSVTLGRTSKSSKTEFAPKSTNGYFDNPIISRRHAILENHWGQVYIIDQSSTHGTFVNGTKLKPFLKKLVKNGDCISLGSKLEATALTKRHLPTEVEIGIVAMDPEPSHFTSPDDGNRRSSVNSFHAPDIDSESEEDVEVPPPVWRPFAPVQLRSLDTLSASQAVPESFARNGSSMTSSDENTKKSVAPFVDLTADENAWDAPGHTGAIEIDSDGELGFDGQAMKDYLPYDYDSEDKESVNGETHVPESMHAHIPQAKDTQFSVEVTEKSTAQKASGYVAVEIYSESANDSWNVVKQYLDQEKAAVASIMPEHESHYLPDPENISDSDEGSYYDDDEASDSEYNSDQDDPISDTEMPQIPTSQVPATPVPESIPVEPTNSPVTAQTQTPPITPEQPLPSRKRTRDEDTSSDQSLSDSLTKCFQRIKDTDDVLLNQVHILHAQNSALTKDLERAVKRQKLEHGWTDAAKTVGKYTLAGVVGGIATVVGLVWSAQG